MFYFQAHFQLSTAITPQIAKASNVLSTLFSPAVFLMTFLLSAIALFYDRWKNTPFCGLIKFFFFFTLKVKLISLSLVYNKEALSDFVVCWDMFTKIRNSILSPLQS